MCTLSQILVELENSEPNTFKHCCTFLQLHERAFCHKIRVNFVSLFNYLKILDLCSFSNKLKWTKVDVELDGYLKNDLKILFVDPEPR